MLVDFFNELLNSKTELSIKTEQNFVEVHKEILGKESSFKPIEKFEEPTKKSSLKKSGLHTFIDMAKEHSERNAIKSGVHGHLLNKSSSRTVLVGREELQNNFVYPSLNLKLKFWV